MKGNQGLELLASMSGDASKVDEGRNQRPIAASPSTTAPTPILPAPPSAAVVSPTYPNPADAIAAALSQQQGNANLLQAAAGLILQQQQQQPATMQQHHAVQDPIQQLAQIHFLQTQAAAAAAAKQAQAAAATNPAALALAMAAQQQQAAIVQQQRQQSQVAQQQQQPEQPKTKKAKTKSSLKSSPIPIAAAPPKESTASLPIAKRPVSFQPSVPAQLVAANPAVAPATVSITGSSAASVGGDSLSVSIDEKRMEKRAANRRSAQLSRKRKKQFIEDLREENALLRRKEQILRAIPDLVVVFDSAGRLLFVSESVSRLLDFSPDELDGSSFWDRICDESVRLLKAAFMDALAARSSSSCSSTTSNANSSGSACSIKSNKKTTASSSDAVDEKSVEDTVPESIPLGSGMWELRLVDRDGTHHLVTLSGVVHFSSDDGGHVSPECVCSIRPREASQNHLRSTFADRSVSKRARSDRSRADAGADGNANVVDQSSSSSSSCSDDGNDGASSAPSTNSEAGRSSSTTESEVHHPNLVRDAIKPQQSVVSNISCESTSTFSFDGAGMSKSVSAAEGAKQRADAEEDSGISDGSVRITG